MNFLKKTWVAIALTVIMVVAAIGVGQLRAPVPGLPTDTSNSASGALDTSLSTSEYDTWISDQAGVLSSSAEEQISLYNANWDYRYNSLIAVLMVDSLDGQDIESYAYDQGTQIGLGQGDALLVAAVDDELYYVATGNDFSTILTSSVTSRLDGMLSSNFGAQRFEEGVLSFFAEMNQVYIDNFGLGNAGGGGSYQVNERTMGVISLLVLLVAALMVLSAIDRARYNSYRARFYGVASPPYVFRPILTAARHLGAVPELASHFGGAVASLPAPAEVAKSLGVDQGQVFAPKEAIYRVTAAPAGAQQGTAASDLQVRRGTLLIEGERESLAGRFARAAWSVLLRESNF